VAIHGLCWILTTTRTSKEMECAMSKTVGGRTFIKVGELEGSDGGARPYYRHESNGKMFNIVPTLSTQWMLETPEVSGADAEIYDSLEEAAAGIDEYERNRS
jgi:hypothetical protein